MSDMATAPARDRFDTSISPSVDPSIIDRLGRDFIIGVTNDSEPVYHGAHTTGRSLMSRLHSDSLALSEAEKAVKAAGQSDDATTADRLRRGASAKMAALRKLAAEGMEAIDGHTAQVQSDIDTALGLPTATVDVNEVSRGGDVRSYLRSLPKGERTQAIRAAIAEGDRAAAAAVLAASPLASGLTRKEAEGVRMLAESQFAPEGVKLRDSIGRLRGILETAVDATESRFGGLTGSGDSAAARAARSLAALEGHS